MKKCSIKVFQYSILLSSIYLLSACKEVDKPLRCGSANITQQILMQSKAKLPGASFIDESSSFIDVTGGNKYEANCKVQINYQHNIFPEKSHQVTYRYQITANEQLKNLEFYNKQEALAYLEWIKALPNVVAYQKTHFGPLTVEQLEKHNDFTHNQIQIISFNNRLIKLPEDNLYSTITIDKKFILNHAEVFLISAYRNAENDNNSDHNYFLYVNSAESILISPAFSYQKISQKNNILSFSGINQRSYAESGDVPIYEYNNGQLLIIKNRLPDSYYQQQFASLKPVQLLKTIKNDGCLNGDQFYLSAICSNKIADYCFKFKAIKTTKKDKSYWLLKQMCQ